MELRTEGEENEYYSRYSSSPEYKYTHIHSRLQPIVHFIALERTEDDTQGSNHGEHSVLLRNYCVRGM